LIFTDVGSLRVLVTLCNFPHSYIMAEAAVSPLKHFVLAKKTITAIFEQLLDYVTEGAAFVEGRFLA